MHTCRDRAPDTQTQGLGGSGWGRKRVWDPEDNGGGLPPQMGWGFLALQVRWGPRGGKDRALRLQFLQERKRLSSDEWVKRA